MEKKLMTLEEYKKATGQITDAPNMSGVACPQCGSEMFWGDRSMFTTNPPMKRLNCASCEYSEVVPV